MKPLTEIQVVHPWTQERFTLPVETVSAHHIRFRWGMAGIYELDIRTNKIRSTNPAVRRKHPHCVWEASNIELVRLEHWQHMNPGKEDRDTEAFQRHHEGLLRYVRKDEANATDAAANDAEPSRSQK